MPRPCREMIDMLPKGSLWVRRAAHGDLWRLPNGKFVQMATGKTLEPRAIANFKMDLRKALAG